MKMKNLNPLLSLLAAFCLITNPVLAQKYWGNGVVGQGAKVKKTLNVADFTGFELAFSGNIYVEQGNTQKVEVEGQQNIIDLINTRVDGNYWKVDFTKQVKKHEGIKVYITVPSLDKVSLSGSGNIYGESNFKNLGGLMVGISGSGNIDMEVEARDIEGKISGSGNIDLEGETQKLEVRISGSGNFNSYNLNSKSCEVRISGSGNTKVNAMENLEVRISGSGDVYYKGRPRLDSRVSGSGDIIGK